MTLNGSPAASNYRSSEFESQPEDTLSLLLTTTNGRSQYMRNSSALKTTYRSLHTENLTINLEFIKIHDKHSNKASQKLSYQTPMVQKGKDTDGIDTLPLAGQCSLNGDHLVQLFSLKQTHFLRAS